jgi:zinc/manganese transport system substrate-binding protein
MRAALLPALLALAVLAGCGGDDSPDGRLPVVATTTQVADIVANVGGDRIDLDRLLAPNADPHDYEPRPSDAEAVARAQLLVRSGGDLDDWLGDVIEGAGGDASVLTLIDHVRARDDDPHWWHDPRNGVRAVEAVRDALVKADPAGRATYESNARAYARTLERLDGEVARCMDAVPAERRKLVTTHDALGYFAARYRIQLIGSVLDSLSTQAQPSAGDTQALVDQMREQDVHVVFAESSIDPRLERAIADEADARVGEPLWADTLGPAGSSGDTNVKSIAANADALSRGFGGSRCKLPAAR